MTPTQYKARYENLVVPLDNGGSTTVRVNRYRLRSMNYNEAAARAFLNRLDRSGVDMELRVDAGVEAFRVLHRSRDSTFQVNDMTVSGPQKVEAAVLPQIRSFARYVFAGKGAPEHCQIVLQLVDHWKLAPSGLQAYADDALGLDCNGFVGNYLWHVKRERPWSDQGLQANEGPDSSISQYFAGKTFISRWEDMLPGRCYILGRVNDMSGAIIDGGGNSPAHAGHITITEPGVFRAATSFAPPAVYVVESTGAHDPGLWESWYSPLGKSKFPNVFNVNREAMIPGHQRYPFRIAEVL